MKQGYTATDASLMLERGYSFVTESIRELFSVKFDKNTVWTFKYDETEDRAVCSNVVSFADLVRKYHGTSMEDYIKSLEARRCLDMIGLINLSLAQGCNVVIFDYDMKIQKAVVCRGHPPCRLA